MSLSCFFGVEVRANGVPVIPAIPPHSSLVVTQCAVTSVAPPPSSSSSSSSSSLQQHVSPQPAATTSAPRAYSAVTLYVQSHEVPTRFAVCTLSPAQQVCFCPLQLVFSKRVAFTLLPCDGQRGQPPRKAEASSTTSGGGGAAAAAADDDGAYPTVHLTGYYECDEEDKEDEEDDSEASASDEDDDGGSDGEHTGNGKQRRGRTPAGKHAQPHSTAATTHTPRGNAATHTHYTSHDEQQEQQQQRQRDTAATTRKRTRA